MQKKMIESNPILKLSFDFSLMVINYCELLDENRKYIISKQFLRSGTSIGANAMEAQNAESKSDFIHKIKIAAKEADETQYWLLLCDYAQQYPDCKNLFLKLEEIQKVLNKIQELLTEKILLVICLVFLFSNSAAMFFISTLAYQHIS